MSGGIDGDDSTGPNISGDENVKEIEELREKLRGELRGQLPELQELAQYTLEGRWDIVVYMYYEFPEAHTARINDSRDTALHVAVDLDEEDVVRKVVNAILWHEGGQGPPVEEEKTALEVENKRGDTPLHVAASRGLAKLCKCIIGGREERLYLRSKKNQQGETPLFLAVLNGCKLAFAYLFGVSRDSITVDDLIRNDGDSILHCAISTEYFELAVIIVHYFDSLSTRSNNQEITPLKVLATKPSAFRSGSKLSWWKLILYHCIFLEPLDAESTMKKILRKMKQPQSVEMFPANYATLCYFLKFPGVAALFDETSIIEESSSRLLAAISGKATPSRNDSEKGTKPDDAKETIDKTETPLLVAARYGIVEMVIEILSNIPRAIYNTNAKKENILLVAVINRQPRVVETLRMKMRSKPKVWNNLIRASDSDENTILHLAAQAPAKDKPWPIAGCTLQMMWDIKWFEYIVSIVPQRFYFKSNKKSETAGQIFKKSHEELVEKGGQWLKDTSDSCSVVAALVAGVSFATASAVPGGNNDEGKSPLQGQPAFDAFAIASLVALCFSVTGLIMFLSILTSRREARDFRRGLPMKLLLGLSSLFVSIIAMFVSFCSGHFFIINHKYKTFLFPFYAATSVPVAFYALAQLPLYFDLLTTIITKVPRARDAGESF